MDFKKTFSERAKSEISYIHNLSKEYNESIGKEHVKALLELVEKHVHEIKDLYFSGDPHALVETGDLIVLCLELIRERGGREDAIQE